MIGPIGRRRRQPGGLVSALPPFVAVLHDLAGCPEPDWTGKALTARRAPTTRSGVCALTGERTEVVDLQHGHGRGRALVRPARNPRPFRVGGLPFPQVRAGS